MAIPLVRPLLYNLAYGNSRCLTAGGIVMPRRVTVELVRILMFSVPQGGWAANQMRATARLTIVRSRWSLNFVKKLTILNISSPESAIGDFPYDAVLYLSKPGKRVPRAERNLIR